jgi:hypothetical protein
MLLLCSAGTSRARNQTRMQELQALQRQPNRTGLRTQQRILPLPSLQVALSKLRSI